MVYETAIGRFYLEVRARNIPGLAGDGLRAGCDYVLSAQLRKTM